MTEAGNFLLVGQHVFHMLHRVFAPLVDLKQHAHHRLIGAAMQRALQGADGAGDGRMHVRKGGRRDPRGEGGGVQFMVGMQDQRHVQGFFRGRRRLFAVQLEQEIGGVRERGIGIDHVLALADTVKAGHDHGNLGGQPEGFVQVGIVVVLFLLGIIERKR